MVTKKNPNASLEGTRKAREAPSTQKAASKAETASQKPAKPHAATSLSIEREGPPSAEDRQKLQSQSGLSAETLSALIACYVTFREQSSQRSKDAAFLGQLKEWAETATALQQELAGQLAASLKVVPGKSPRPRFDMPQQGPGQPDYAMRLAEVCVRDEISAKQAAIVEDLAVRTHNDFRNEKLSMYLYSESPPLATKRWRGRLAAAAKEMKDGEEGEETGEESLILE